MEVLCGVGGQIFMGWRIEVVGRWWEGSTNSLLGGCHAYREKASEDRGQVIEEQD